MKKKTLITVIKVKSTSKKEKINKKEKDSCSISMRSIHSLNLALNLGHLKTCSIFSFSRTRVTFYCDSLVTKDRGWDCLNCRKDILKWQLVLDLLSFI